MPRFDEIVPLTARPAYRVTIPWRNLDDTLRKHIREYGLNVSPPFQRIHVWTQDQEIAFVEHCLRNGPSGREIYANHPHWQAGDQGAYVLVDGKQRLKAILRFLRNEIPAFGYKYSEYEDKLDGSIAYINWNVNELQTEREVLQWYLALNTGGTPHSEGEIARVRGLLAHIGP